MKTTTKSRQGGFAVVEIVLVVAIFVAVAGVGYWVYQQRTKTDVVSNNSTSQSSKSDQVKALVDKTVSTSAEDKLSDESAASVEKSADADVNNTVKTGDKIDATSL